MQHIEALAFYKMHQNSADNYYYRNFLVNNF